MCCCHSKPATYTICPRKFHFSHGFHRDLRLDDSKCQFLAFSSTTYRICPNEYSPGTVYVLCTPRHSCFLMYPSAFFLLILANVVTLPSDAQDRKNRYPTLPSFPQEVTEFHQLCRLRVSEIVPLRLHVLTCLRLGAYLKCWKQAFPSRNSPSLSLGYGLQILGK